MLAAVSKPMKDAPMTTSFFEFSTLALRFAISLKSLKVNTLLELAPSTGILRGTAPLAIRSLS